MKCQIFIRSKEQEEKKIIFLFIRDGESLEETINHIITQNREIFESFPTREFCYAAKAGNVRKRGEFTLVKSLNVKNITKKPGKKK